MKLEDIYEMEDDVDISPELDHYSSVQIITFHRQGLLTNSELRDALAARDMTDEQVDTIIKVNRSVDDFHL